MCGCKGGNSSPKMKEQPSRNTKRANTGEYRPTRRVVVARKNKG